MNAAADTLVLDVQNPWPGLLSFPERAEQYFNGRERERDDVMRLIRREPLSLLYGHSGLGKTSLLMAGVFPQLKRENFLPVYVRVDYSHSELPPGEQMMALLFDACAAQAVDAPPRAGSETLWEYLHRKTTEFWSERNQPVTPVFIIDQFEEILTLGHASADGEARSQDFLVHLADLVNNTVPRTLEEHLHTQPEEASAFAFRRRDYRFVLGAREDFVPELEQQLRTVTSSLMQNSVRLNRLTGEQAHQAIVQTGGHLVSDDVAHRIVRFLAGGDQAEEARLEIEPALLSVFCRGLNEERKRRSMPTIGEELLGGSKDDILSRFYEDSMAGLAPGMRLLVEEELLTEGGYRNSCAIDDALRLRDVTTAAINTLVARRLVRLEERFGLMRVELTHDVLTGIVRESRDRRRAEEAERVRRAQEQARTEELLRAASVARRQRGLYAVAAAVLLVFAIGAAVSSVNARRAEQRARASATRADSARTVADNARTLAVLANADVLRARDSLQTILQNLQRMNQQLDQAVKTAEQRRREALLHAELADNAMILNSRDRRRSAAYDQWLLHADSAQDALTRQVRQAQQHAAVFEKAFCAAVRAAGTDSSRIAEEALRQVPVGLRGTGLCAGE